MGTLPIIMADSSVRGVLAGTKTQTRRVMRPLPPSHEAVGEMSGACRWHPYQPRLTENRWVAAGDVWAVRKLMGQEPRWRCPYGGTPGDRLWVRERHAWVDRLVDGYEREDSIYVGYHADRRAHMCLGDDDTTPIDTTSFDWNHESVRWRPAIHMPRWASRLTLDVVGIRVERLQDISEEDAIAEGMVTDEHMSAREQYSILWDQINAKRGFDWTTNPWVWVVTFKTGAQA